MAYTLVFRRYAPFTTFGGGFEGDVRTGPSTSPSASSRTIGTVPFDPSGPGILVGSSSGTAYGSGPKKYSKVTVKLVNKPAVPNELNFTASTAGANPMVPGAPDIDTFVDIKVAFGGSLMRFSGAVRGDNFPNAEVLVFDDAGTGALLFDYRTSGGRNTGPFTRLMGDGAGQTLGSFGPIAIPIDGGGNFMASVVCPTTKG